MAPPPATPSPYRFVPPSHSRPGPHPPSSLRNRYSLQPSTSAPQFAPTPKFLVRPSTRHEDVSAPTARAPLVSRARRPAWKAQRQEEIEETAERRSDEEGDDDFDRGMSGNGDVGEPELPLRGSRPHKRRRSSPVSPADEDAIYVSSSPAGDGREDEDDPGARSPSSTSSSQLGSPTPAAHHPFPLSTATYSIAPTTTTTTPRFHLAPPPPSTATPLNLPKFIIPTPTPTTTEPVAPLPEAFSPHRRGAKYLPSGLAATCRDWVLSASQLGAQTRRIESVEATWAARVRVQEVRYGEGMLLVRSEAAKRWMLVGGHGAAEGLRGGEVLGVRRPVWEVEVRGETWGVGVEWSVLGEGGGS